MKELGVSFHVGSKENSIKCEADLKKADAHNNRKYKNKNNQELDPAKSHENVIIVGTNNIIDDVKKVYKDEFTEAVYDYNMKQKREDRKILDYYEQINNDKQTNLAVEMLFQLGDYDNWKDKSMEDKKKMVSIYSKAVDILKDRNIITAQATVHFDESCPHMHLIAVPIAENNKRGVSKQVSQNKVLTIKAIKEIREEIEKVFISEYKKIYKEDITLKKGSELPDHLDVKKYKKAKEILKVAKEYEYNQEIKDTIENELENVKEEIKEIKEKLNEAEEEKENKIEKIENVKKETNNLTNELTNLEEKNYSLNSEVKELETSKKTKEKEKDDIEKELDLYQKKIKDYKDQIQKDKEDAIKLEEEQKKIEADLKAQEKKIKDIKDEIDKKNKDYNDSLTEKNNLEEKQKKLDAEKQKIAEFYKNMETIITAEKEKMIKDAENVSIKLTEEKKKLENENLELVNNNNELLQSIEAEKEKNTNITKEKEKIEKENKEIENAITDLKQEKINLEANKLEITAGVKTLLENQKNYSDTLQLEYKKLENKKEVEKTADNNVTEIALVVKGDFYREAIYGKDYKSDYIFFNGDNIVERIEGKEKDNLTYTVASAVYSIYGEEMQRTDLIYNTKTGKTDLIIDYVDYETEEKKTDTITFKEMKIDKFFTLVKEKLGELKEAIIESIKQQFNYTNNNPKDVFTEEKNKKNIDAKNNEREY